MPASDAMKNELRIYLEDNKIDPAIIDDFFMRYEEMERAGGPKAGPAPGTDAFTVLAHLREAISKETNWRQKAALNAQIISHKLENGLY